MPLFNGGEQVEYRMGRLASIRDTAARLAAEKSATAYARKLRMTQHDNDRYYAKVRRERVQNAEFGGSPYERAVKRIARLTGVPASQWEHDSRHPYTQQAVRAAQILAGLDPLRQPARAA